VLTTPILSGRRSWADVQAHAARRPATRLSLFSIHNLSYGINGANIGFDMVGSHNIMLSLRYYLTQPPPPPPPLHPAAASSAAATPVTTYIVFFDFNKSNLTEAAQAVVTEAVRRRKPTAS